MSSSQTTQQTNSPNQIATTNSVSDIQLEQIGVISTIVEGQVPIIAQAIDGTTRILITGEPIYLYDVVLTADNSNIKIILDDDTVFQLGPNSRASLDKYVYDPDALNGEFEAFVSSGSFHYISGKISGDNQGQHTLIKTPSAQIGIRGSEISAEISSDGSTTVLHMSGLMTIISNYSLGEILIYERGTSIYIPSKNISHTLNTLTEEQIQSNIQKWQIDNYSIFDTEIVHESKPENELEHEPGNELEHEPENELKPESIEGKKPIHDDITHNPYSPSERDIHSGEPLDAPLSNDRMLEGFEIHREFIEEIETVEYYDENIAEFIEDKNDSVLHPDKDILPNDSDKVPDDVNPPIVTIAKDDAFDIGNNNSITIVVQDLLNNDIHSKDDPFEVIKTSNGTVEIAADNIIFTRDTGFSGVNDNGFDYQLGSAIAHVSITGNLPPIAVMDETSILENQFTIIYYNNLLNNDFDPNPNDTIIITGVSNVSNGTIQLTSANNAVIFTPINAGNASFEYIITDNNGASTIGLVEITVIAVSTENTQPDTVPDVVPDVVADAVPNAVADEFSTLINKPLTITTDSLLANDTHADGDSLTVIDAAMIDNGNIIESNGNIIFTPNTVGIAKFEYTIQDSNGATDTAIVTIFVSEIKFAIDDVLEAIPKNVTRTIENLLDNDIDSESLVITAIDKVENGTVLLVEDNVVQFTPNDDFVGDASFEYMVTDIEGNTDTAKATFVVENSQPIVTNDIISIADSPIATAFLLTNDFDLNHDQIEIIAVSSNAQLIDNKIIFTSDFTYTISDGDLTDTGIVTVVNNIPPDIIRETEPLVFRVADQPISIGEITVIDNELPNFAESKLEVAITQNRTSNDLLKIENIEPISVSSNTGGDIFHNETKIGNFITDFITGALLISFNEAANASNAEALIQAITYQNTSPNLATRILELSLNDGDTEITVSREIQIVEVNIEPIARKDNIEVDFNVYTKIPVTDLLQNDTDANPTDILKIMEVTPISEGIEIELVGNEIQLFVDGLVNADPVEFGYVVADGEGGENETTVIVNPTNIITGTDGNDNFDGTDGIDIVLGGQGDDTFHPSTGADILLGEEGDDTFYLSSNAVGIHIDGGEGNDKISLDGVGNQRLDLIKNSNLPDSLKLQGVDKIDITGENNQLHLQVEDVLDISDDNRLVVDGEFGNMVNSLGQGWDLSGTEGIYNVYTNDIAQLLVSVDINNQFIS